MKVELNVFLTSGWGNDLSRLPETIQQNIKS